MHTKQAITHTAPTSRESEIVVPEPVDPRMVARVEPGVLREEKTSAVTTHHYEAQPIDGVGAPLAPPQVFTIAYKNQQDVLDGVFLTKDGTSSETRIIASRTLWPILTARNQLGAPSHPAGADGMLVGLPGAFVQGSINRTLRMVEESRVGVTPIGQSRILGGASVVLPNSPEIAFPRYQQVAPIGSQRHALLGDTFGASRETFAPRLQEVIDRSLAPVAPSFFCLRLLERTLRVAEHLGEPLELPVHLHFTPRTVHSVEEVSSRLPILNKAKARALLSGELKLPSVVSRLEMKRTERPREPFLREYKLPVTTISETGQKLQQFDAELIARKDVDSVVAIGRCVLRDASGNVEPYIVVNIGARVALASRFRENHVHPISLLTSERHLEVVSGTVGSARTTDELATRACAAFLQETGVSAIGSEAQPIMRAFSSPAFSPDCYHLYFIDIDPTSVNVRKKTNSVNFTCLMKASDVRELVWDGTCTDLVLSAAAALAERSCKNLVPIRGNRLSSPAGQALAELSGESIEGLDLVHDHVPELLKSRALRVQVRNMLEREGQDAASVTHVDETIFFSPLLPESPKPEGRHGTILEKPGYVLLMDHDDRHYFLGELIPFIVFANNAISYDSSGAPRMLPRSVNREILMTNEAYALYGDAQTARSIGIERYERLSGEPSAARIFDQIRQSDPTFGRREELAALYQMVVKGTIPRFILEHPDYESWRKVIRSKLIGYYVRDRPNSDLMYEYWKEHPTVAQAALDFCPRAATTPAVFAERFNDLMNPKAELREGFNPLKARLERLWRSEIPRIALNLALLKSYALKNGHPQTHPYIAEITDLLGNLRMHSRQLAAMLPHIHNMEPSDINLDAAELFLKLTRDDLPGITNRYQKLAEMDSVLTENQINERRNKKYFLTKSPDFHTAGDMEHRIEALEFQNFDREGLKRPPSLLAVIAHGPDRDPVSNKG